jgi:hypothetical protein
MMFNLADCDNVKDKEVELYQACLNSGITLLSVGHRYTLQPKRTDSEDIYEDK